jgi:hypothetical membrane protein
MGRVFVWEISTANERRKALMQKPAPQNHHERKNKMNVKQFALCGMLAPFVFALAFAVFSLMSPGYSNLTNMVSELGMTGAPYALAWNAIGFFLVGALTTAYAWGLRLDMRPASGSTIVPLLVAISGLGFAGLGLFPAETGFQASPRTTLHFVMVSVNFLPFILVAFIFPTKMKGNDYWKKWALFSVVMGVLAIASFFIPKTVPLGLSQRIGMGANFLWLFVTSLALFRKPSEKL